MLSETIDTSFQGQLTCHFHSLEGLIIWVGFCLWFFFPFCHFITQEEGCLQVIKDTPFWYTVITFSADTAGFFDSIAGFAFRSGFFGFVSDGFCFACCLDGSRDTFFIWIVKNNTSKWSSSQFLVSVKPGKPWTPEILFSGMLLCCKKKDNQAWEN